MSMNKTGPNSNFTSEEDSDPFDITSSRYPCSMNKIQSVRNILRHDVSIDHHDEPDDGG